ncbi:MAG: hypothetical protein QXR65_09560, partial [Candidatus Bathyarchaeia archaeon]
MPQDGEEFNKNFVENGVITNIWRNERSWATAKGIASYLSTLKELAGADIEELRSISEDDKTALRSWARNSSL